MITASILSAIFLLLKGDLKINIPESIMGDMIYLAVFPTFLCYTMQIKAQKHTIATHAAIIMSLESVFATLLAVLFLKEKINFQMVVGFIFIFTSVLTSELGESVLNYIKEKHTKATGIEAINQAEEKSNNYR